MGEHHRLGERDEAGAPAPVLAARRRSRGSGRRARAPPRRGRARRAPARGRAAPTARSTARRRRRRSPARPRAAPTAGRGSPRRARTRAARWLRGPLVPAVAGPAARRRASAAASASTSSQVAVPEVEQGLERVRDPASASRRAAAPRGLRARRARRGSGRCRRRSAGGRRRRRRRAGASGRSKCACASSGAPRPQVSWPRMFVAMKARNGRRWRSATANARSSDVEALAQPPRDERVPAVGLGRARPQQLVADRLGDLHRPPRGLEPGLDAQAVRERGRHADLEVAERPAAAAPARARRARRRSGGTRAPMSRCSASIESISERAMPSREWTCAARSSSPSAS